MKRAITICALVTACTGSTTGDSGFTVEIQFAEDALPAPNVPLFWSLEVNWPDGTTRNEGRYDGSMLTLGSVPDGPDRRVKVELFAEGHVYYHGESEPFDLGETRTVTVVLVSAPAGSITIIGDAALGEDAAEITHSRIVTIRITALAGTHVRLGNDEVTVAAQGETRALSELTPAGIAHRWDDWQLAVTPCCDASESPAECAPRDECKKTTSVYAVFMDAAGEYRSQVVKSSIDFDDENWICTGSGSGACVAACGDLIAKQCDRVILVDADALNPSLQDGTTWDTAFDDLQSALGVAAENDEIWVAAGTYRPDEGPFATDGDATSTFQLKEGVEIFGGFSGAESSRDQRDWTAHETVLHGDLDGNPNINASRAYHVVRAGNVSATAVLDGFTITEGDASGDSGDDQSGGGMYVRDGSPRVRNCRFVASSAYRGGALYVRDGSPTFENTTFVDNRAIFGGGAVRVLFTIRAPTFIGCTFEGNTVSQGVTDDELYGGGAVYLDDGGAVFDRCRFINNVARWSPGGAIYNYTSFPASAAPATVVNSAFVGNRAADGGAIYNRGTTIELVNDTFFANCSHWSIQEFTFPEPTEECLEMDALHQGTVFNVDADGGAVTIANSIFHGNAPIELVGTIDTTYSCVGGGAAGTGNIDCDPAFADEDGIDDIPGNDDDDLRLGAASPAIDAGDSSAVPLEATLDLDGAARFVDDPGTMDTGVGHPVVDMGAYEYR